MFEVLINVFGWCGVSACVGNSSMCDQKRGGLFLHPFSFCSHGLAIVRPTAHCGNSGKRDRAELLRGIAWYVLFLSVLEAV